MGDGAVAPDWPLVGRAEEMRLLDAETATRPVVVAGPPGVGKSRLVADWSAGLPGAPVRVIATRASATVPFGAFAPWVPAGLTSDRDRLDTLRGIAEGVLDRRPAAIVIDDAHLLDDGSAALALHLAGHGEVPLVVTVRAGTPCPDPVIALWKDGIGVRIDLRPLSERETTDLLALRLGGRVHATAEQRLWSLSAGNPMYLREVTEAALEQDLLTEADGAWSLAATPAGAPRLVDLVQARIGRIDPDDRAALELVALGEPLPAAVLGDVVPPSRLARLAGAGLLTEHTWRDTVATGLCHPLYGEVLRSTIPPIVARAHHRTLARAMVARGEGDRDPLRVARWMGDGEDAAPAELLVAASTRAMVLQDYGLAAQLASAAAEADRGVDALLAQARALRLGGDAVTVELLLDEADQRATTPQEVAEVAEVRAMAAFWEGRGDGTWTTVVDEALAGLDPTTEGPLAVTGASLAVLALDLPHANRLTRRVIDAPDRRTVLHAATLAGWVAALEGRPTDSLAGFDERLPEILERMVVDPLLAAFAATSYELAMELAGRSTEAEALLGALVGDEADGRLGDDLIHLALPSLLLAHLALASGRVRTAASRGRRALELMGEGQPFVYGRPHVAAAVAASAAAQAGEASAAAEVLARVERRADDWIPEVRVAVDRARAWTAAARGEIATATATAMTAAEGLAAAGAHGPEVLVLMDATRLGGAAQAAPRLGELADRVEGPLVGAASTLARALADGDGHALDDASAALEGLGLSLVAAEAASQAAARHAAAGLPRAEAAAARRARTLLEGCEGASTPLLAGGGHDVARELTAREREVALMVTAGRTNREVAEALGVSTRTVNSHLNHAYAKLGTSDREELAVLLAPLEGERIAPPT